MRRTMTPTPSKSDTSASPWLRSVVIFAILVAGVFAFPGGMVDWLDERNESGWLSAPLALARGVDAASAAVGVKQIGQGLRHAFASWVGADEG
jgi:hypothetical protein